MEQQTGHLFNSLPDLIADPDFQSWVLSPTAELDAYWADWQRAHPDKQDMVFKARFLLQHLDFKKHLPTKEQVEAALKAHPVMQDNDDAFIKNKVSSISRPVWYWLKRAAIIIGVLFLLQVGYRYWQAKQLVVIQTAYGEIKSVYLPDSSKVVLDAHTKLSYKKDWSANHPREVWLEGNGFFEVNHLNKDRSHIKAADRFLVHTSGLEVEVLGTCFDVHAKDYLTKVVLQSGLVQLNFEKEGRSPIKMHPGDLIAYQKDIDHLTRSKVDVSAYTSWKDQKMILDNETLATITDRIKRFYGLKIIWKDTTLKSRAMEGTLLMDNISNVIFVLSTSLNIHIEQSGDSLIIDKPIE